MIPENGIPTHPGVILSREFLGPLGASQVAFAAHLRVSVQCINEFVHGKRGITSDTAGRSRIQHRHDTIPPSLPVRSTSCNLPHCGIVRVPWWGE